MKVGLDCPLLYKASGAVAALLLAGLAGFYIRGLDYFSAPVKAVAAAKSQPNGIRSLPPRAFGHWKLMCIVNGQGDKKCELLLRVTDRDSKKLLMNLVVTRDDKGKPMFVVVTPPSVVLPAGVKLVPAGKPGAKANFLNCKPGSCEAARVLDDAFRFALSSASTLQVSYVAGNGHPIGYNLPVDGFKDGYTVWAGQ
jgi:invasion protein IalB